MQKEHQQLPYRLLVSTLHDLCKLKKTGTMYICTDDNHAARFTIANGKIVACGFGSKRGMQALELVRGITAGKYSFADSQFPAESGQEMSTTKEILDYLSLQQDSCSNSPSEFASDRMVGQTSTLVDNPSAPAFPPVLQELVLETQEQKVDIPNPDDLLELLQQELALYIGPLGPAVCSMHSDEILGTETIEELRAIVEILSQEMGSSEDAQDFRKGVWAKLA